MKRIILYMYLLGHIALLMGQQPAAENAQGLLEFVQPTAISPAAETRLAQLRSSLKGGATYLTRIQPGALSRDRFSTSLPDGQVYTFDIFEQKTLPTGSGRWRASLRGAPHLESTLTGRGNRFRGSFALPGSTYYLEPLGEGLHLLYQAADLPEAPCGTHESGRHSKGPEGGKPGGKPGGEAAAILIPTFSTECKLRVLVAYTRNVAIAQGRENIQDFILDMIEYSNDAYTNTGVGFQMELARSVEVVYSETNTTDCSTAYGCKSKDLIRFWDPNDGFMDEIHDLRGRYDADLCILLADSVVGSSGAIGGQAMEILAGDKDEAFAIMWYKNQISTFPHELGHLQGCRHDFGNDNSITPFSYGHGKVDVTNAWRTVMAYATGCSSGSACPRIKFFSNSAMTFNGAPLGDGLSSNNLVLDGTIEEVIAFEQTLDTKNMASVNPLVLSNYEMADVYAHLNINAAENFEFTVRSEASVSFRAGEQIRLFPGFQVSGSGRFSAEIVSCENALTGISWTPLRQSASGTGEALRQAGAQAFGPISLYPNPAREEVSLQFELSQQGSVRIALFDAAGKEIPRFRKLLHLPAGIHRQQLHTANLPAGMYHLQLYCGQQRLVKKLVVVK
ncbi:MAG: T9SS C-terminal target domain-containing protein [Bacteroidetes bacterium]|nr:MAG: T9SS C-terminal target domain-containing protein [Bacteroidota bacterium]